MASRADCGSTTPSTSQRVDADEPPYKRRRVALACASCRNRKTRCNGAKPSCSLCTELGFRCIYEQPTKSSSQPTPSQEYDSRLKAIEDTLQRLAQEQHRSTASNGTPIANSTRRPAEQLSIDQVVVSLDRHNDDSDGAEGNIDGMATIVDPDQVEAFFGPSSNVALIRDISEATTRRIRNARGPQQSVDNDMSTPRKSSTQSTGSTPKAKGEVDPRLLPPEATVLRLIDAFFDDTGMLFPYVHKGHILDSYAQAKARNFAGVSASFLGVLNIIFAFATYISAEPERAIKENGSEAETFFERARSLARTPGQGAAKLEMVQGLLLMSQYRQGTQHSDDSWALHSLAYRSAMQLGLHSETACKGLSALETEVRKRTWWVCVLSDRILSMTYGRPMAIPKEHVILDPPLNCSLDSLKPRADRQPETVGAGADTVCHFIASLELYDILGDIINNMFGANLEKDHFVAIPDLLEPALPLEMRLCKWRERLPRMLLLRPWDSAVPQTFDPVFSRLSVILRLRFLNVRALLHRPIFIRFLKRDILTDKYDSHFLEFAHRSIGICYECATETINIVHTMSATPSMFGAWWFTAYYTFNSALALFACLLLNLDETRADANPDAATLSRISDIATTLRRAIQAVEKLGGGTRPARKIRKMLVKLVKTSAMLAQPAAQRAIVSAFSLHEMAESAPSNGVPAGQAEPLADTLPSVESQEQNFDPYGILGTDMSQLWENPNWHLFEDIVGLDGSVGSFTAP